MLHPDLNAAGEIVDTTPGAPPLATLPGRIVAPARLMSYGEIVAV